MTDPTDLKITLAVLDETARAAYQTMRGLGLSVDAAKDALTVHVSDLLGACQRERDGLPTPYDDGDPIPRPPMTATAPRSLGRLARPTPSTVWPASGPPGPTE